LLYLEVRADDGLNTSNLPYSGESKIGLQPSEFNSSAIKKILINSEKQDSLSLSPEPRISQKRKGIGSVSLNKKKVLTANIGLTRTSTSAISERTQLDRWEFWGGRNWMENLWRRWWGNPQKEAVDQTVYLDEKLNKKSVQLEDRNKLIKNRLEASRERLIENRRIVEEKRKIEKENREGKNNG